MVTQREWIRGGVALTACLVLLTINGARAAATLSMKACELLTAKDVESVLGAGYLPQGNVSSQIMSSCAYVKNKDNVDIMVTQVYPGAAETLRGSQEGARQHGASITPVSGLGVGAFYLLDSKTNVFQLHFGKGNLEVTIIVETAGKPNVDAAMKLAKIAYSRLK